MSPSRLQKNLFMIGWDDLGQFRSLYVPLLFPNIIGSPARNLQVDAPDAAKRQYIIKARLRVKQGIVPSEYRFCQPRNDFGKIGGGR